LTALSQEGHQLSIWDQTGEIRVCDQPQKAAEEQMRLDKELALSRAPPEGSLRQFATSIDPVRRLLPFRVVYGIGCRNGVP
jgi:hypothetical protein